MTPVRALSRKLVVLAAVLALLGGGVKHDELATALSHGSFLFPPDHPAHAPFVPPAEHICLACALAALSVPAPAPVFLVPPPDQPVLEVRAESLASAPDTPELPGRSPPPSPA